MSIYKANSSHGFKSLLEKTSRENSGKYIENLLYIKIFKRTAHRMFRVQANGELRTLRWWLRDE